MNACSPTRQNWCTPENAEIVVDTMKLSAEEAADLIVEELLKRR